jgi:hypothetical protein
VKPLKTRLEHRLHPSCEAGAALDISAPLRILLGNARSVKRLTLREHPGKRR